MIPQTQNNINEFAGASGYITITGSSYAFGVLRGYASPNYTRSIRWVDGWSVSKCSGWVTI